MSRYMSTLSLLMALSLVASFGMARAQTADENALHGAAWDGKLDQVERLLEKGTDPNAPNQNGWTALHHAADRVHTHILESLLAVGGNPDAQDLEGRTALHLAALFPYDELRSQLAIRVLLRQGAKPDRADSQGVTPLHVVAGNHRQPTSAQDLLAAGADPNKQNHAGDTPLHAAVGNGSKLSNGMVEALVEGGAQGDVVGAGGETPLQLFVRVGSNDGRIVKALVDAGADVDAKNPEGESPLHTAIRNGGSSENDRVVEALLAAGADPCIKDASGYIPYNTAREGGTVHTVLANAGGSDIGCQGAEVPVADYIVDSADWPGETTTRTNMRSGPGRDYDVLETLDADTAVQVTGMVRNTDWLRVEVAGDTVFIHASLVREADAPAAMETSEEERDASSASHDAGDDGADQPEVASAESPALATAMVEEDVAEGVSGQGQVADAVSELPSPLCPESTAEHGCWIEIPNQPGCYMWINSEHSTVTISVTWSGLCTNSRAAGTGDMEWVYDPKKSDWGSVFGFGPYVAGKQQGDWILHFPGGDSEGPYVNGVRHGYWIVSDPTGVMEGPYVYGERHGNWSGRTNYGSCSDIEYSHDVYVSLWVEEC